MATVYLGLGTNLGDKEANLRTAIYKTTGNDREASFPILFL